MYSINATSISSAHSAVCKAIIEGGEHIVTEDGQETWELDVPIAVKIVYPMQEPMYNRNMHKDDKKLIAYLPMILSDINTGHEYTYGERIAEQVKMIEEALRKSPNTRRAVIHTWKVGIDNNSKSPPCLQLIQFVVRNGELNMIVYFRSNDMALAYGDNMYGMAHLLQRTATRLGLKIGYLQSISACPHIYNGDIQTARRIAYGGS